MHISCVGVLSVLCVKRVLAGACFCECRLVTWISLYQITDSIIDLRRSKPFRSASHASPLARDIRETDKEGYRKLHSDVEGVVCEEHRNTLVTMPTLRYCFSGATIAGWGRMLLENLPRFARAVSLVRESPTQNLRGQTLTAVIWRGVTPSPGFCS